mgnify:CR=1 FL=1
MIIGFTFHQCPSQFRYKLKIITGNTVISRFKKRCFRIFVDHHDRLRLVHTSSHHAVEREPLEQPLTEERPLALDEKCDYHRSKAIGETVVLDACRRGLNATIVNPGSMIGPYDYEPSMIGAALIVVIAYALARLLMSLITEVLHGIGFDSLPERLGLGWSGSRTPSQWLGYLLFIVVMIYAASAAVELLGSVFLVETLDTFTAFFWRVILAVIIFAIGLARVHFRHRDDDARMRRVHTTYVGGIEERNAPFPLVLVLIIGGAVIWMILYIIFYGVLGVKI